MVQIYVVLRSDETEFACFVMCCLEHLWAFLWSHREQQVKGNRSDYMNADIRQPCGAALLLSCSPPPHIVYGGFCACARAEDAAGAPETLQCLTRPKVLISSLVGCKNTTRSALTECKTQQIWYAMRVCRSDSYEKHSTSIEITQWFCCIITNACM